MSFNRLRTLQPIEWLLAILLIFAPLYFHPNLGGTGLRIPNNIVVWSVASFIGFYSLFRLTQNHYFYIPRYFLLMALFPVLAFLSGMISGVEIANQWTFRILYIWGGLLFFFGLFQHQLKQGRVDRLLLMVVIAGLFHSIVGISQIIWTKNLTSFLPMNTSGIPTGLFQQINNQASFQVTCIIIALWLATRPIIAKAPIWRFLLVLLAISLGAFVVSYSGSRVGTLGFILALPLLLLSRWQFIKRDKRRWWLITVLLLTSITSASIVETNRGLTGAFDKATAINAGFSGEARLGMYSIAYELIKDEPVFGHGIGSFVRVWQLAKPDFYAKHPDATLPSQRVAHPHNEIIFWLVEGGIIVGIGLLLVFIGVLMTLAKLPPSRRYAYAALLLPIALHTQVELPFYISASHWFVFLLLFYVIMQPSTRRYRLVLSDAALKLIKVISIAGTISVVLFFSFSMAANLEFKRYLLKQVPKGNDPFPVAVQHPYFKKLASHTLMMSLFNSSVRYGLDDNVRLFSEWGEQELKYNPHIAFYQLTVQAHLYLKQDEKACSIAKNGLSIYPNDRKLKNIISNFCISHKHFH